MYTDGACKGHYGRLKRAGTSVIQLNEEGQLDWAMHVIGGDIWPSSFRSELQAMIQVVNRAAGDVIVHTDNALVVQGFWEGPIWCTAAGREGADLWRRFWSKMCQLNSEGVELQVKKVKGHATKEDVSQKRVRAIDAVGNHEADKAAVSAARAANDRSPALRLDATYQFAIDWYKWSLYIIANWVVDTSEQEDREAGNEQGRGGGMIEENDVHIIDESATNLNHDLWTIRFGLAGRRGGGEDRGVICRICGAQWPESEMRRAEDAECKGSPVGRAEAFMTKDKSAAWRRGSISIASLRTTGAMRIRPHTILGGMEGVDEQEHEGEGGQEDGRSQSETSQMEGTGGGVAVHRKAVEKILAHAAMGHRLTTTGPILWCVKCVAFAHQRHGAAFKAPCTGYSDLGARRARRRRLTEGKHPLTEERL